MKKKRFRKTMWICYMLMIHLCICVTERRENEYDTAKGAKCKHLGKAGDGYQAFFVPLLLQLLCKSENKSIQ